MPATASRQIGGESLERDDNQTGAGDADRNGKPDDATWLIA
jgi:hypothetical protein